MALGSKKNSNNSEPVFISDCTPGSSRKIDTYSVEEAYPSLLDGFALDSFREGDSEKVYEAKARLLNAAMQEIGMGPYQWKLFVVVGFGWAADNLWPIVTSLILGPVSQEFNTKRPELLTLSQNLGLLFGALVWGFGSDIFGRKICFNITVFITAIFALISASSTNFLSICIYNFLWSTGVGGNLPVDSAIFLEFLPGSHQYLLTVLSVFWSIAQLLVTLLAWPLLSNFSCQPIAQSCSRQDNLGWRWLLISAGSSAFLMFLGRCLTIKIHESPKYLMGKGREEEAVAVVQEVARRNKSHCSLTIAHLEQFDNIHEKAVEQGGGWTSSKAMLLRRFRYFNFQHLRDLFSTPVLALSTVLITTIWAFIGLAFPLYNAFIPLIETQRGIKFGDEISSTYRNSLIIAAVGLPGSLIGAFVTQIPRLGRKGSLAITSAFTGISLFGSLTANSSSILLVWNCVFGLSTNFLLSILYSYTPEIFLTKNRGTGNALTASVGRICGTLAPVVFMLTNVRSSFPVYISGSLFLVVAVISLFLPLESRGSASL
ncbi:hypothetical protein MJO28_000530 [Puccinia striiformis f. sp. tritici]|uniref:Major facilitator superfamily (MFS) profile domain-containing protein n=3 Tax=Puccinia striiformis TaxID=27350 RepID=A0A0L0W6A5_9BASI|nr:hypothetical protein Pst134EB_001909 [Puccinia striiformis f. sp. tritici]KAI7962436.1 hypothetical protein MJO28_000530 [Puccinia striiformis f. sp. tritici]KNF06810.1 hypothetical protein PSTG_00125 [Puccinia striiformis f. sp. tritici PST-78]POW05500.1 hypothetical protein PSHT_10785 [Puccinia striiformis]